MLMTATTDHHDEFFSINQRVVEWFFRSGRHDLPWQVSDPYKVWVSEIMLQQTQVKTVLQYFDRFTARFPDYQTLGQSSWDEVAPYWAGLGYYARARNLHKAARLLVEQALPLPDTLAGWIALPGIGKTTAGAIMSLAYDQPGVILDGNVKRVLSRVYLIGSSDLTRMAHEKILWQHAEQNASQNYRAYSQGIMDLGATICLPMNPSCLICPLQQQCKASLTGQQQFYPEKPLKKAPLTRDALMWIIWQNGRILLEQRPENGIWGGLWSLPVTDLSKTDSFADWRQLIADYMSSFDDLGAIDDRPIIEHQFTHFTYYLKPVELILNSEKQLKELLKKIVMTPANTKGFFPSEIPAIALPAPVKKFLKIYFDLVKNEENLIFDQSHKT